MKKLLTSLFVLITASALAQVNVIYFKIGDTLSGSGTPNLVGQKVTLTDTTQSPRVINGIMISPKTQQTLTKSDAKAYFTNVVWGTYNVKITGPQESSFDIQVETNTTGTVDGATLLSITNVPNPISEFYTKVQVDAIVANIPTGGQTNVNGDVTGFATNNAFSAQGIAKIDSSSATAASAATNSLVSQIAVSTGAAALVNTNQFVGTSDTRSINLANTGNQFRGRHFGGFYETNGPAGPLFRGLEIGANDPNSFLTSGSAPGNETLTQRFPPAGFFWASDDNSALLMSVAQSHGSVPDMSMRLTSKITSVKHVPAQSTAEGAPISLEAPYIGGSASSMIDLPTRGPEIWKAKPHPWIGPLTDVNGQDITPAGWRILQIVYTNLPNVAKWFNTNGTVSALAPYGIQMGIWGDTGALTNRDAGGSLMMDPFILTSSGFSSVSNYVYAIHTNGLKLSIANYRSTIPVNVYAGDTGRVQTNGQFADVGYPSQVTTTGPIWSVFTPETIEKDMLWYYTNYIDEMFVQDAPPDVGLAGYEQQISKFAYATLYLNGQFGDHIFWKDYKAGGYLGSTTFPRIGDFTNQMILGWFINQPNSQTPFMANDWSPDQAAAVVGTDTGLGQSMSRFRAFMDSMSEWPDGVPCFPIYALGGAGNNSPETFLTITNTLAVSEMGHGNLYFQVDTNTWGWNAKISQVLTNAPLYLATWQDNLLKKPVKIFDDGTNGAWVRPIDGGKFAILAVNQSANGSNFNANVAIQGGIATNVVYFATNLISGDAFGSGYLTNKLIATVPSQNCFYVQLTPALPQTRIYGGGSAVVTTTNRNDGGQDVNVLVNTFDTPTNTFSGTTFELGTNQIITCASNIFLIDLGNLPPAGIERCGQLTIRATADLTVTNSITGWQTSDMVSTRTLTNGNSLVIAADVILGVVTNFAVVQFH